jgi:hypothetical protein
MKLLSVKEGGGYFRDAKGDYKSVDKIAKEDLLQLVHWTLHEDAVEFDDYDEQSIKNHAHQIIYKSVQQKLRALRSRKDEFVDESARTFLEAYEQYRRDLAAMPEPILSN